MAFGLGSHSIDQALALFGRPSSVMAHFASNRGVESDVDDTFTMFLVYPGNLTVTIKTAIITHMKEQLKFFFRGTEGTYLKVNNEPLLRRRCHFMERPLTVETVWLLPPRSKRYSQPGETCNRPLPRKGGPQHLGDSLHHPPDRCLTGF